MGRKKKIAKFFKEEGKKLPLETYQAFHKFNQIQFIKQEADDSVKPAIGVVEKHLVNHGRRLKRLYNKHGKQAVDEYFKQRGFILVEKQNETNEELHKNTI